MAARVAPLAVLVVALLAPGGPVLARDLHVQPVVGSDTTGDGSLARPWKTLTHALASSAGGDVVHALPGTYSTLSGETFPLSLRRAVALEGAGPQLSRVIGEPAEAVFLFRGATDFPRSTSIRGLSISGGVAGVGIVPEPGFLMAPLLVGNVMTGNAVGVHIASVDTNLNFTRIESCTIADNRLSGRGYGIFLDGSSRGLLSVDGCTIRNNGAGIQLHVSGGVLDFELTDSVLENNDTGFFVLVLDGGRTRPRLARNRFVGHGYSMQLVTAGQGCEIMPALESVIIEGLPGVGTAIDVSAYSDDCPAVLDLRNCMISGGDTGIDIATGGTMPNAATIVNTTIADVGGIGIFAYAPSDAFVQSSILWNVSLPTIGDGVRVVSSDLPGGSGSGNFDADPLFVDPAARDYRLSAGSPCIDRAESSGAPLRDFEGDDRANDPAAADLGTGPIGWVDVGADERPAPLADTDGDGVLDGVDDCPADFDPAQLDTDGDGRGDACDEDDDDDGIEDVLDSCPLDPDPVDSDRDNDGLGDPCDPDDDGDGIDDAVDNCPRVADPSQADTDGDTVGDACDADADGDGVPNGADTCPLTADPSQADADADGVGDACDACPTDPSNQDSDADGICDVLDNCPGTPNASQADLDLDGLGDACDPDADGDGHLAGPDDCDDFEPGSWALATEVTGLRVTYAGSDATLTWDAQDLAAGPDIRHDVIGGSFPWDPADPWAGTSCIASLLVPPTLTFDPGPNGWFMVRARNACNIGPWGDSTVSPDPRDRLDLLSPCP